MFKESSCVLQAFTICITDFVLKKEYVQEGNILIRFTFNILLFLRKKKKPVPNQQEEGTHSFTHQILTAYLFYARYCIKH